MTTFVGSVTATRTVASSRKPDRQRLVATRELLRQEAGGRRLDLDAKQVEVFETVLLGQELGNLARGDPAVGDDDLTDPPTAALLLSKRGLELIRRQNTAAQEQRAEGETSLLLAVRRGRFVPRPPSAVYRARVRESMRAVCQRVSEARVRVGGEIVAEIGPGLCILLGVARGDTETAPLAGEDRPAAGLSGRGRPLRPEPARHRRRRARRLAVHAPRRHRQGQPAELLRSGAARGGGAGLRAVLRRPRGARRRRWRAASSARRWPSSS